ncbi:MAG: hypothetical protein CW338_05720 [Clostridiales bacterium]|nr:hypothetical protein [Clostridiales bacterium]
MFCLPQEVKTAIRLLKEAGHPAYPVGGCVRDTLMGSTPNDWDMCTGATPEQMHAAFAGQKIIDTGIRHGTVTLVLDGRNLEITTFRLDGDYEDGRHPLSVTYSDRIDEDLMRRDFTVNAMAYDPEKDEVIDLFGGREDLEKKIIRCVGDPEKRFEEDALRILRAARFSAKLGFTIEENTLSAMKRLAPSLNRVSRERIAQEMSGLLTAENAESVLLQCKEVIFAAIPELAPMDSCPQVSIYHDRNVWEHTALAVKNADRDLTVRWATLLHDIGKPACHTRDEQGYDHFAGHQDEGMILARQVLEGLKMPKKLISQVTVLVKEHDITLTDEIVWPLLAQLGSETFDLLLKVKYADLMAHADWVRPRANGLGTYAALKEMLIREGRAMSVQDLAVRGNDLAALGIRSKAIGETLNRLFEKVVKRECENTREALLQCVREIALPRDDEEYM